MTMVFIDVNQLGHTVGCINKDSTGLVIIDSIGLKIILGLIFRINKRNRRLVFGTFDGNPVLEKPNLSEIVTSLERS